MDPLNQRFKAGHGVLTAAELKRIGMLDDARARIDSGEVRRLRRGVYAPSAAVLRQLFPEVAGAAARFTERRGLEAELPPGGVARALGGRLTCLTALRMRGHWTPSGEDLHIRLPRARAYDREFIATHAPAVKFHRLHAFDSVRAAESLTPTLLCAQECCDPDELVAVCESLVRDGIGADKLAAAVAAGGPALRRAAKLMEEGAESGIETLVRLRLRRCGIQLRTQVRIDQWRADMLIGDWLVVEVDGYSFHRDRKEFVRDRRRDRALADLGYHVRRFSYDDVMFRWPQCEAEILRLLQARVHMRPSRPARQVRAAQ
jgi:very-short-patch-repair endonuclease